MSTVRTLLCMIFVSWWFVGCQKPVSKKQISEPVVNDSSYRAIEELQAKLYDIPFPIDAEHITLISHPEELPQTCALSCQVATSTQEDLQSLYHSEMERMGWKELSFVATDHEIVACFQKPTRCATLVVQEGATSTLVKLFVQQSEPEV